MMKKIKTQHYVPQFYLRNFSSNKKQIFVYDKIIKSSFSAPIDSVASSKYFYDWQELDETFNQQFIENAFAKFESETAPTFVRLISRLESGEFRGFNKNEMLDLSEFIWYQMIRNPETREILSEVNDKIKNKLSELGASKEVLEKNELAGFDNKKEHLKFLLDPSKTEGTIRDFCNRIWIAIENKTKYSFFTSDNPVIRYTHWSIGHLAYEIFYPITSKFAIWILLREPFKQFEIWENKLMPFAN